MTDVDFMKLLTNKRKLVRLNLNDFMAKPIEKSMSIAEIFLRKPSRRTYNRIVFEANPDEGHAARLQYVERLRGQSEPGRRLESDGCNDSGVRRR